MATVTMKELLEAGVHFGHQVRRWNPKMKEYIFGERNGIYIIDLQKTQKLFRDALSYVQDTLTEKPNRKVLFVGTKRQAQDSIKEEAERAGQFYVNNRWLGGLLTNFQTVQKSIKKMLDIERMREDGSYEKLTKKERLTLDRAHDNLMKNLAGIRDMKGLPDMLFIIDVRKEDIAVKEANRLGIPVVAVVDTNCSPEGVDYVIPGNDDALRAVRLFSSRIADAILEGQQIATEGSVSIESQMESGETDSTETSEAEINVADKTFETAEETNPVALETNAEGKRKPEVAGADNEVEVRSEIEAPPVSEDVREVIESVDETNAAGQIDQEQTEEKTEASAS
ncbi:MAG: 30S ribosomal protein S2 [Pyrinomonadaceae bacterium]